MVKYSATTKYHEFLSAITEHAAEGIIAYSRTGTIILANAAAAKVFGVSKADLERKNIPELVPDGERKEEILTCLMAKDVVAPSIEFDILDSRGVVVPLDVLIGTAVLSDGEEIIIANCRDISLQKQTEERLVRQAEIIRQMHDAIVVADGDFKIVSCNAALSNMVARPESEICGKSIYDVVDVVLPDGATDEKIREIAIKKNRWNGIVEMTNHEGTVYTTDILLFPMRGEGDEIDCFISVVRDVGDRLDAERRIQETQRIESLGRLAGGVAHDINNLLFPIFLNLEDAADCVEEREELDDAVSRIRDSMNACMKIKKMVEQILHFSRDQSQERTVFSISECVQEAWDLTKIIVPSSFKCEINIGQDCGTIYGNTIHLSQILLNLVSNAVASQDPLPGTLNLSLKRMHGRDIGETGYYRIKDVEYAVLSVTDRGCGIPEDIIDNIFDPFFTTKPVGEGTGLGLTEVAGIMRDLDGAIDIVSVVDEGTTMTLYFPVDSHGMDEKGKLLEEVPQVELA